ncbi:hypothetical protein ACFPL7_05110 [Dongia soli]|uniref:Uncharacterized protein n=1 Tax=Dongia soli TaxID=600628 RepID=A0ABU5EH85_9PROT|nr:hypothetical protein [Dongia soli]MDY0884778.1 hypothetical protein [Dongia soli]
MTTRTVTTFVVFNHPFRLTGLDQLQPPGNYEIETDEETIDDLSFIAYRRVSTLIHLHPQPDRPGIVQTWTVDPSELVAALAADERSTEEATPVGEKAGYNETVR